MTDKILLTGLEIECVIGIFDWERKVKQTVSVDLDLDCDVAKAGMSDDISDTVNYKEIAKEIIALVAPSKFYLIEKMAERIAMICLATEGVKQAKVTVSKPGAVRGSKNVSIQIVRPSPMVTLYLGVGGNIDPERNIPAALSMLSDRFQVIDKSPVYKSTAWGVKEPQPDYLNLAVKAVTDKDLFTVRAELRWIEELLGRKRTLDKFAPRRADIDLLLYGNMVRSDGGGVLPHHQLTTQQFVYMPMMDLDPDVVLPGTGTALKEIDPQYESPDLKISRVVTPKSV